MSRRTTSHFLRLTADLIVHLGDVWLFPVHPLASSCKTLYGLLGNGRYMTLKEELLSDADRMRLARTHRLVWRCGGSWSPVLSALQAHTTARLQRLELTWSAQLLQRDRSLDFGPYVLGPALRHLTIDLPHAHLRHLHVLLGAVQQSPLESLCLRVHTTEFQMGCFTQKVVDWLRNMPRGTLKRLSVEINEGPFGAVTSSIMEQLGASIRLHGAHLEDLHIVLAGGERMSDWNTPNSDDDDEEEEEYEEEEEDEEDESGGDPGDLWSHLIASLTGEHASLTRLKHLHLGGYPAPAEMEMVLDPLFRLCPALQRCTFVDITGRTIIQSKWP